MADLTKAGSLLERTRWYVAEVSHRVQLPKACALLTELHDRIVELTPPASHSGYPSLEWDQMNRLDRFAVLHSELVEFLQHWPGPDPDRQAAPLVLVELAEFLHYCPATRSRPGNERYAELRGILHEKVKDVSWRV